MTDPAPSTRAVLSGAPPALFVGLPTNTIVGIALPAPCGGPDPAARAVRPARPRRGVRDELPGPVGGAVGVAAFGAMISARLRSGLPAGQDPGGLLGTPERVAELPAQVADSVRASCTAGPAPVFLVAVPLAAAALAAVLLIRETPLDTRG